MKIKFKRSNQLQNGSAKAPSSSQLDYGELATNYNSDDPALFIKDSDNNIVRVNSNVSTGDTPPSNPASGSLWYNTTEGRLMVYYSDSTSSQWVDASPGGESGSSDGGSPTPGPSLQMTRREVVAPSGGVTYSVDSTLVLTSGQEMIFLNGVLLKETEDYVINGNQRNIDFKRRKTDGTIVPMIVNPFDLITIISFTST